MLTRKTTLIDYMSALRNADACIDVMSLHEIFLSYYPAATLGDLYDHLNRETNLDNKWIEWIFYYVGRVLDSELKSMIINKLADPITAVKVYVNNNCFTADELQMLEIKCGVYRDEAIQLRQAKGYQ